MDDISHKQNATSNLQLPGYFGTENVETAFAVPLPKVYPMPLFPVDETSAHEDVVQKSTNLTKTPAASGSVDDWLKVGQSYRYHPPGTDQRSSPAVLASPDEGAGLQSPSEIGERRPSASGLFNDAIRSPVGEARDHSEEASTDGELGSRQPRGKADKHSDSRSKGKRKRHKRSSSLSSDDSESSGDGSPRHRKKGRKRDLDRKESRRHRQNEGSTRKSSKGSRNGRGTQRRHKTSRSNSEDGRKRQSSSRRSTASPRQDNQLFVEDRRGDPDNLTFGGFYRLDVPVYHSVTRTGKMPRNGTSGKSARYFASQARNVNNDGHVSRMQLWKGQKRRDQARLWSQASASLSSAKASAQAKSTGALGETSGIKEPRNSPEFLPVDHTVIPPDAESANSYDERSGDDGSTLYTESLEQWVTRRTKEFNQATREQPNSEELWLQYTDFQDEAVRALHGSTSGLTPSTAIVRMILEKRASVLEGALHRNPGSVALRTAHLQLAEQLQEHDAVDSLWRKALVKTEHSSTVWLRYLKFKSGHFASFSASSQRRLYSRSVRALESKGKQASIAYEKKEREEGVFILGRSMLKGCKETLEAEASMLDVLWSYCVEERAMGYEERALAALQAMLELNIRSRSSSVSIDDLEQYWDSEAPRIGDAHPSHAGIARWLETQAAPSSSVTSLGEAVDPELANLLAQHRPPPAKRPPGPRPQRKRAVDFFARDQLTSTDGAVQTTDPTDTSLSGNVGARDRVEPKTGNSAGDVLESAYRAAVALAASAQRDPEPPKGRTSAHHAITAQKTSPAPGGETTPKESGSAPKSEQDFAPPANMKGKSKASRPATESDPVLEQEAGAVDAEGLIWVDESQGTAYSVRHGYRIDVQNAVESVSGLEYDRILTQMQGGDAPDARRRRTKGEQAREEELLKEAAVLEDVSDEDPFCTWAEQEDEMTRREWQPLRALVDPEGAEEQPDRVVFVEDLKPLLFHVSQPCSLRILVGMLLSSGGLAFTRSCCSHSSRALTEAVHASSLGNGGWSVSLLAAVENGLQAVWTACGGNLLTSGKSFSKSIGQPASSLPALSINVAADQFLLLTDDVIGDPSRQSFLRNVLHHLIRSPELLPSENVEPGAPSTTSSVRGAHADILVQLQCALMMFEGWLAAAATSRLASRDPSDDDMDRGRDARKVAKSLLEASQASATDLRLWCSYVQLLALLDCREEAIKVAEKALSMVQDLPEDKKPQSAELFWLAFRLQARLPLSCRDSCADATIGGLFSEREAGGKGSREMALHVLCSFAEGRFKRAKTRTRKAKRHGKGLPSETAEATEVTPPRLMTARRLMADHVARISADLRQGANSGGSHQPGEALDMTPPLMYYSACWVWLEYLTRGPEQAEQAMSDSLKAASQSRNEEMQGDAVLPGIVDESRKSHESSHIGKQSYSWRVVPEGDPLAICLERMHRAFCEVLVLAQRYNAAATGPRRVRAAILRGLQSFPAEPGMLALFLDAEKFSGSQQRVVHHLYEVSRRRALSWEQGPTGVEWVLAATHQVRRCVSEARETIVTAGLWEGRDEQESDEMFLVKNWTDGSYSRLQRWMETAVTHPTGRGMALLWRMYMSLEAMRGHHTRAKHLFWRAIHACPGCKAVWMDAFGGNDRGQMGVAGLRPAFREKELQEILDALLEKSLHIRGEPP